MTETFIDLTPRGCTTPEGQARVSAAMHNVDTANAELANATEEFLRNWRDLIVPQRGGEPEFIEEVRELDRLIEARAKVREEFLRAVAGVPPLT